MTLVVLNLNTIKYIEPFYYSLDFAVDCILVFFSLVFEVYFDGFLKEFVLKIVISISLKYIGSNLVIVFITYRNFQSS